MTEPRLRLSLLGPPLAELDGAQIEVDTRKAIALLAYLAVTGRPQSRDALADLFWPEVEQERARAALRRTLSTLRAALDGQWLDARRELVSLDRQGLWLDVDEFHRLLAECGTHGHPSTSACPLCLPPLTQAVALHRADLLAGFGLRDSVNFDDWQLRRADELRRELCGALDLLAEEHGARGEYGPAIEHARRRLSLDPLHEPAHRRLIELYARSGERAAAIRQYRECVRTLHRELGVPPLEETTSLYRAITEGSLTPAAAPVRTSPTATTRLHPFVGRAAHWKALLETYAAVGPDGRLVVLEGETGIGKTRLGQELLGHLRGAGAVAVEVRCFEGESGLAYGVVIELLRSALERGIPPDVAPETLAEVGRLLPDLASPSPTSLDGPGARARFYDAIVATLLAALGNDPAGTVFVDDVHWADEASLAVLAYLVRRLRGRPLLLVASWRTPGAHPARELLAVGLRTGVGRLVTLHELTADDVAELVRAAGAEPALAPRLYEETQGVALFVVEYLDTIAARADPEGDWPLPGGLRDLLRSRLAAVGDAAGQLLAAAAVIGRSFDVETVRSTSGRSEDETVAALEELTARGLIAEVEGAYDFRHDQARALAYAETSLARRRVLHRRLAEALSRRRHTGEAEAVIAHHFRLAGETDRAAEHFRIAGEHSRRLYANAEALSHFRDALALGHADAAGLHEAIGDLETLTGDYAAALVSYETAAALAEPAGLAAIEHKLGGLHHRRGEWETAEGHFEAAHAGLGEAGERLRARILADRSLTAHRRGRRKDAVAYAKEALAFAEKAGDERALAQAHNILGILSASPRTARKHLERSLELAEAAGDEGARVAALNNLALSYRAAGELERAIELTDQALSRCATQGDRHREAALQNNLADLLHAAGRPEEAMRRLKEAVTIFAEIDEDEGERLPEVWKLVEW